MCNNNIIKYKQMKKISIAFAILFSIVGFAQAQKLVFKIKGSDTSLPLTQKELQVILYSFGIKL